MSSPQPRKVRCTMNGRRGGSEPRLNRRDVLGLAVGVAAAGALTACGGGNGGAGPVKAKALRLPSPVPAHPADGVVISRVADVPPAFVSYPKSWQSVAEKPGRGGSFTTMQINYQPPPPPLSKNKWLQEFNRRIGATQKATLVSDETLAQKTQTFIGSGDLPDILYLNLLPEKVPAAVSAVQQGAFLDLSEYISGAGDKDFPNLGRIPQASWQNSAISGGLFGVPRPEPLLASGMPLYRSDWMRRMGGSFPTNADEFAEFVKAYHDGNPTGTGQKTWAWGSVSPGDQECIMTMFGVPNLWKNDGGKLVKDIETDEFEACLEWLVARWKEGCFHPNSAVNTYQQHQDLFNSGQLGLFGYGLIPGLTYLPATPIKGVKNLYQDIGAVLSPGAKGGKGGYYQGPGNYGMFSLPAKLKGNKDRVRELLGILNYMAAPFGSEEFTFMNFGIEGHNYTLKDGQPISSSNPAMHAEMASAYGPSPYEANIYIPGPPSHSVEVQKLYEDAVPSSVPNPVVSLITPTMIAKDADLTRIIHDGFIAIVTGRQSLSSGLKSLRSTWASQGGEKLRGEFQDALAKK
jgi:putative aldouronate transport system substrate-binding protein